MYYIDTVDTRVHLSVFWFQQSPKNAITLYGHKVHLCVETAIRVHLCAESAKIFWHVCCTASEKLPTNVVTIGPCLCANWTIEFVQGCPGLLLLESFCSSKSESRERLLVRRIQNKLDWSSTAANICDLPTCGLKCVCHKPRLSTLVRATCVRDSWCRRFRRWFCRCSADPQKLLELHWHSLGMQPGLNEICVCAVFFYIECCR